MRGGSWANVWVAMVIVAAGLGAGAYYGLHHAQPPKANELFSSPPKPASSPPGPPAKPSAGPSAPTRLTRWAGVNGLAVLETPDVDAKVLSRLDFGQELMVEDSPWKGPGGPFVPVAGEGHGYVRAPALLAEAPDFERLMGRAREALRTADLEGALEAAGHAAVLRPREKEPLELLYALHRVLGDEGQAERARAARLALGPLPEPEPPPAAAGPEMPFSAGELLFVVASRAELRGEPSESAPALSTLARGAAVKVLESPAEGARWLKVAHVANPTDPSKANTVVSAGYETPLAQPVPGYVRAAPLARFPKARDQLLDQGRSLHAQGRDREAIERFERALGYEQERVALHELFQAALADKQYEKAARASKELAWELGPGLELDFVYGCRGNRARAKLFTVAELPENPRALPEDACVRDVAPPASCAPCAPSVYDYAPPGESVDTAAYEAARRKFKAANDAFEQAVARGKDTARRLRDAFPDGPFLHVHSPRGTQLPWQRTHSVFLYTLPLAVEPGCGSRELARKAIRLRRVESRFESTPSLRVDAWFPVDLSARELNGLVTASDEASARSILEDRPLRTSDPTPRELGPIPNVWGRLPSACACCE